MQTISSALLTIIHGGEPDAPVAFFAFLIAAFVVLLFFWRTRNRMASKPQNRQVIEVDIFGQNDVLGMPINLPVYAPRKTGKASTSMWPAGLLFLGLFVMIFISFNRHNKETKVAAFDVVEVTDSKHSHSFYRSQRPTFPIAERAEFVYWPFYGDYEYHHGPCISQGRPTQRVIIPRI